jgi:hypothetical protein
MDIDRLSITSKMGARIPLSTKSQVIQKWMAAIPRAIIAVERGLNGGAVSGIVAD